MNIVFKGICVNEKEVYGAWILIMTGSERISMFDQLIFMQDRQGVSVICKYYTVSDFNL